MDILPDEIRQKLLAWSILWNPENAEGAIDRLSELCVDAVEFVSFTLKHIVDAGSSSQPNVARKLRNGTDGVFEELKQCIKLILYLINAHMGKITSMEKINDIVAALSSALFDVLFVQSQRSAPENCEYESIIGLCFYLLKGSINHAMDAFLQCEYSEHGLEASDMVKMFLAKVCDLLKQEKSQPIDKNIFLKGVLVYHKAGRVVGYGRKVEKSLKKVLLKRSRSSAGEIFKWIQEYCPTVTNAMESISVDSTSNCGVLFDVELMSIDNCDAVLEALTGLALSKNSNSVDSEIVLDVVENQEDLSPLASKESQLDQSRLDDSEQREETETTTKEVSSKKRATLPPLPSDDSDIELEQDQEFDFIQISTVAEQGHRENTVASTNEKDLMDDMMEIVTSQVLPREIQNDETSSDGTSAAVAEQHVTSPVKSKFAPAKSPMRSPISVADTESDRRSSLRSADRQSPEKAVENRTTSPRSPRCLVGKRTILQSPGSPDNRSMEQQSPDNQFANRRSPRKAVGTPVFGTKSPQKSTSGQAMDQSSERSPDNRSIIQRSPDNQTDRRSPRRTIDTKTSDRQSPRKPALYQTVDVAKSVISSSDQGSDKIESLMLTRLRMLTRSRRSSDRSKIDSQVPTDQLLDGPQGLTVQMDETRNSIYQPSEHGKSSDQQVDRVETSADESPIRKRRAIAQLKSGTPIDRPLIRKRRLTDEPTEGNRKSIGKPVARTRRLTDQPRSRDYAAANVTPGIKSISRGHQRLTTSELLNSVVDQSASEDKSTATSQISGLTSECQVVITRILGVATRLTTPSKVNQSGRRKQKSMDQTPEENNKSPSMSPKKSIMPHGEIRKSIAGDISTIRKSMTRPRMTPTTNDNFGATTPKKIPENDSAMASPPSGRFSPRKSNRQESESGGPPEKDADKPSSIAETPISDKNAPSKRLRGADREISMQGKAAEQMVITPGYNLRRRVKTPMH